MTEILRDIETPSDAELISRVRGGDIAAYGELFARHKTAANRLARQLVRGLDSDDLVAEAFAKVLTVLRGGGGPDVAFRAYLLTAVRRLHIDRVRSGQRLQTTDDMAPFDPGVPFQDTAVAGFERGAAAKAFASLPERWQLVLWHLEVEGQKPADIAPLLGMSANSVSALAYRAREGLRQAFLTMHLSDTSETDCRWVNEHLGAFVRQGLSKRDATKVQKHLDGCRRCSAMYLELDDVNSNLAGIIGPLLLGAAAAGYLASGGAGAAVGVVAALSKVKEVVVANSGAAAAAGVASAVAAAAVIAVVVTQGGGPTRNVVADPPAAATSSVPAGPTGSPSSPAIRSPSPSPNLSPSVRPSPSASSTGSGATPAPSSRATRTSGPAAPSTAPTFSLSPLPAPAAPPVTPAASASAGPIESSGPIASSGPTGPSGPAPSSPTTAPAGGGPSPGGSPAAPTAARVVDRPVLHADGTVTVAVRRARDADNVDVTLTSRETTFPSAVGVAGCRTLSSRHVLCRAGASAGTARALAVDDLSVRLPLAFPDSMLTDDVDVTASVRRVPGASASTGPRTFRPARIPRFDFVAPVLGPPVHTLAGDEDRYDTTTTAVLPPRVTGLVYTLSSPAYFRPGAADGCTVGAGGRTLRCPNLGDGDRVTLPVAATGLTTSDQVSIQVSPVHRFVDPSPGNDTTALTLLPGADLNLSVSLATGTPQPGLAVLIGRLTGQRQGLASVVYSTSPGTTFAPVTALTNPGCTIEGARMTCPAANGDVRLVLVTTPSAVTPVTVSVSPSPPFEAVGTGPHSADVVFPELLPEGVLPEGVLPVLDFTVGSPTLSARTVTGDTDLFTLTSAVTVPAAVRELTFRVVGGMFAAEQLSPGGCSRVDAGHVTCGGLTGSSTVALRVESTATSRHQVVLSVLTPQGYRDLGPGSSVETSVSPAVDLHLGPLTPADPVPTSGGYRVSGVLTGVRSGPVTFEVSGGASVTATTCTLDTATSVTCASPTDGQTVGFTLTPTDPAARTRVTIRAAAPDLLELNGEDNTATATLAPDIAITALSRRSSTLPYTVVRAQIAGVPTGVTIVRLHLSGPDVGLGALHFTSGADGADGEGDVDCFTSSAVGGALTEGVDVTCTDVARATDGSFWVDTRLTPLLPGTTDATFTVSAVDADEGGHTGNNRRVITLRS